jgi:hypothetical protein
VPVLVPPNENPVEDVEAGAPPKEKPVEALDAGAPPKENPEVVETTGAPNVKPVDAVVLACAPKPPKTVHTFCKIFLIIRIFAIYFNYH